MKAISAVVAVIFVSTFLLFACDEEKGDNSMLGLALASISAPPAVTTKLIMYNAGVTHDGNLGGRSGADTICSNSVNKPSGATNIHAFISTSDADDLTDMPGNYGYPTDISIYGPSGLVKIADNWADILDATIDTTLYSAGVFGDSSAQWHTGSGMDGTYSGSQNCSGFTTASSGSQSLLGDANRIDWGWINGWVFNCDQLKSVLCICEK